MLMGCTKDNSSQKFLDGVLSNQRNQLPTEIQLLDLLQEPVDGYIAITSYATLAVQPFRGPEVMIRGYGYDKQGNKSNFGDLTVGAIVHQQESSDISNEYYSVGNPSAIGLFGTEVAVSLSGNSPLPGLSKMFYVPKMMTVTSPSYSNNSPIAPGTTITWIPDERNAFGVGIAIVFDSNDVANKGLNGNAPDAKKLIHTEDDGSYTFTTQDLSGIPADAIVTLGIGRGNYQNAAASSGYSFGLISYSVMAHSFRRQ
jgi:hypothetical protein